MISHVRDGLALAICDYLCGGLFEGSRSLALSGFVLKSGYWPRRWRLGEEDSGSLESFGRQGRIGTVIKRAGLRDPQG